MRAGQPLLKAESHSLSLSLPLYRSHHQLFVCCFFLLLSFFLFFFGRLWSNDFCSARPLPVARCAAAAAAVVRGRCTAIHFQSNFRAARVVFVRRPSPSCSVAHSPRSPLVRSLSLLAAFADKQKANNNNQFAVAKANKQKSKFKTKSYSYS